MIIAIDVGNTNIVLGCIEKKEIHFTARFSTEREKTEDEYALMLMELLRHYRISAEMIEGAIISSVVPELKKVLETSVIMSIGKIPIIVSLRLDTGLNVAVENPYGLGTDLVTIAVAAIENYPKPIMIFDMGTATTLSVIDEQGTYLGGMIIPGVRLSVDALSARTSQLPKISLTPPRELIGTNTVNCMKAGVIYGSASMLDGLVDRVEEELGKTPTVIATGGIIGEILPYCKRKMIYDENLMLWGLQILYEKNKNSL